MNLSIFAHELSKSTSEQQIKLILQQYLSSFGFRAYAFTYYSRHTKTGSKLRYHCVSDPLRSWHNYYIEQGYADADRTLEENHTMTLPLYWDVHEQLIQAKNKRELRIRTESIEFGIDKGLSIPVHGPHHDFASLTLHQLKGEAGLADYQNFQYEWLSAANIFYHFIKKILDANEYSTKPFALTKREAQCLSLTAKLWRVEKIAKELNISPRTVNFHIQNANKKLGTNNKYLAIYKYY